MTAAEVADREHLGWRNVNRQPTRRTIRVQDRYSAAWVEHLLRHDHGSRNVAATDEDVPKGARR